MPQITVQVERGRRTGAVMLQERVSCSDLDSDHFAAQLVQRIGWAMLDAEHVEADTSQVPGAATLGAHSQTQRLYR
jgi:hypothetical protein